jgi:hypothetical protein
VGQILVQDDTGQISLARGVMLRCNNEPLAIESGGLVVFGLTHGETVYVDGGS